MKLEDSNVVALPMVVDAKFFAVLNRAAARRGMTAAELFSEKMKEIAVQLAQEESRGEEG